MPSAPRESPADADRRPLDLLRRHPLVVVGVGATLIALGHVVWIWRHRHLGGLDPDESGYIASALRMERSLVSLDPLWFVRTVGSTGNGITVPLLSVPFAVIGPRDPRVVMAVQPALLVFTAVGTAGITRRLAGPYAAIGAGLLVAALPTMSTAAQSYWYGMGAAACLVGAIWALLASERCTNRRIWWFGVGVGLMCLSRTMALGYVPAVVVAGLVVAGWDRRHLTRLALSLGVAAVVAAPWYVANRDSIFGYLLSYGYGPRAARFGSGNVAERTVFRMERYRDAFGPTTFTLLWASALCVGILVASELWRRRRSTPHSTPQDGQTQWRAGAAVAACLALGTAALVSTSNNGVWFELPMVPLIVALLVAVISAGPQWYALLLALALTVPTTADLASRWWIVPYRDGGPTSHFEHGFAQYDERFGPTRRAEHREAAREWDAFYRDVLAAIRPESTGPTDPLFTLSGNMQMFNTNSLTLTGELSGWSPRLQVPETVRSEQERSEDLTSTVVVDGREVERVLLVARHDRILFTPDSEVESFERQAQRGGWAVTDEIEMPIDGSVVVMRHRDTAAAE